jgi:hypothetical protein
MEQHQTLDKVSEQTQLTLMFSDNISTEQEKLQYIRDNIHQKTNRELAVDLGLTFGQLRWLQRTHNLTRDQKEYSSLRKEMGKRQAGENNPNFKGWLSKNHMHYKRLQQERYPEHVQARMIAQRAARKGIIKKQPCEVCSDPEVQMHHEDHSKPLEVIFLCIKHHKLADQYLSQGIKFSEIKEKLIQMNNNRLAV